MIKAVIFDMDGLMFDTENLTIPLWDIAGQKFGYRISAEVVYRMVGINNKKCREVMLKEYGEDFPYEEIRAEFRKIVRHEIETNGVPKKPGLDHILEKLASANIPIGLATSTRRETAEFMLKKAGVFEKFSALTCGDEIENGKPAPDIFLKAAEKLNTPPDECVGLEDSTAGLTSLHAAGIRSIFIKDLIEPPPEVLATVWRRCKDLFEAAEVLRETIYSEKS